MTNNKELEGFESQETQEHDVNERMFTQDEVNRIIKQRLAKVKETNMATEEEIARMVDEATAARNAELDTKENQLNCRLYVAEKGYPKQLLDALDTSNLDNFKQKADSLMSAFVHRNTQAPIGSAEPSYSGKQGGEIEMAFSQEQRHTPKQWPPRYEE